MNKKLKIGTATAFALLTTSQVTLGQVVFANGPVIQLPGEETTVGQIINYYQHNGVDIIPPVEGADKTPKEFEGYRFIETETKVTPINWTTNKEEYFHKYRKLVTKFVNENNDPIDTEVDNLVDPKEIPNWTFSRTDEDDEGNRIHYYKPLITSWLEDGTNAPIINDENGTLEKQEFDDYVFLRTVTDDNVTIHYYKRKVTKFLDNGNPVETPEDGFVGNKEIPGYVYVTTTEENGERTHIYRKAKTYFKEEGTEVDIEPALEELVGPKEIDKYFHLRTVTNEDNYHYYLKKVTKFMSEEGPILEDKEGFVDAESIDDYILERTEEENNIRTHYYKLITTKFIDENNEEVFPEEKGNKGPKTKDGYIITGTKDEGEVITHTYRKVYTYFKDKEGNELLPKEFGKVEEKDIPGFRLISTKVINGDTIHTYEEVTKEEEPQPEEPTPVEPKPEEPKSEEPKTEEPKTEEPKTEEPKDENPQSEEPKEETPTQPEVPTKPEVEEEVVEEELVTEVPKEAPTREVPSMKLTRFVDREMNDIITPVLGQETKEAKEISGWKFVTSYVDEEGTLIFMYDKLPVVKTPVMEGAKPQVQTGDAGILSGLFASISSLAAVRFLRRKK